MGFYVPTVLQDLESRRKALQDKHDDLSKEVAQRQQEVRYLSSRCDCCFHCAASLMIMWILASLCTET